MLQFERVANVVHEASKMLQSMILFGKLRLTSYVKSNQLRALQYSYIFQTIHARYAYKRYASKKIMYSPS